MAKRDCGECGFCCEALKIDEGNFHKKGGEPCKYLNECGYGCKVYGTQLKPKVCTDFNCGWMHNMGGEEDRPDKSGVFLHVDTFNGGTWVFVMELWKDAHFTTGKEIIIDTARTVNLPIIVVDYETPSGKDFGDYVILHERMEKRASQIRGDFMYKLADDVSAYKLIVN
jgi:hypothetical protein